MNRRAFVGFFTSATALLGASLVYLRPNNLVSVANASLTKNQKMRKVMKFLGTDRDFPEQMTMTLKAYAETAQKNPTLVKDAEFAKRIGNSAYQKKLANKAYSKYIEQISRATTEADLDQITAVLNSASGKALLRFRKQEGDSIRKVSNNYLNQISQKLFKITK